MEPGRHGQATARHKEKEKKLEPVMAKILTRFEQRLQSHADRDRRSRQRWSGISRRFGRLQTCRIVQQRRCRFRFRPGQQTAEKFNDDPEILISKFFNVIDSSQADKVDPRVAQMVLKAANRAVELSKSEQPIF